MFILLVPCLMQNRVQALAATTPMMTCVGNHEREADTFAHYLKWGSG